MGSPSSKNNPLAGVDRENHIENIVDHDLEERFSVSKTIEKIALLKSELGNIVVHIN